MIRSLLSKTVTALAVTIVVAACSDASDAPDGPADVDPCERYCERWHRCDDAVDRGACQQRCAADLTEAGRLAADSCAAQLACHEDDLGRPFDACLHPGLAVAPVSGRALAYCAGLADRRAACGAGDGEVLEASCRQAVAAHADDVIRDLQACLPGDCRSIPTCLDAVVAARSPQIAGPLLWATPRPVAP